MILGGSSLNTWLFRYLHKKMPVVDRSGEWRGRGEITMSAYQTSRNFLSKSVKMTVWHVPPSCWKMVCFLGSYCSNWGKRLLIFLDNVQHSPSLWFRVRSERCKDRLSHKMKSARCSTVQWFTVHSTFGCVETADHTHHCSHPTTLPLHPFK